MDCTYCEGTGWNVMVSLKDGTPINSKGRGCRCRRLPGDYIRISEVSQEGYDQFAKDCMDAGAKQGEYGIPEGTMQEGELQEVFGWHAEFGDFLFHWHAEDAGWRRDVTAYYKEGSQK